ncbi:MAG: winged helix-turn-helix domain-containing protein [Candidatus Woesearchaeota archaeon]
MVDDVVKTGVDELLEFLAHNAKTPLSEVATKLKLDVGVVQAWVDFLVEEGIIGIEYRFTTPYIYLNKVVEKKQETVQEKEENYNIQYFKEQFWAKARSNNIPDKQIDMLWKNHVIQALDLQKKYFFFEAQRRKINDIEQAWQEYRELIQYS